MTPRFFMGVDLGQAQDYTGIAVLEQKLFTAGKQIAPGETVMPAEKLVSVYQLKYLERMPLGTPYTDIVEHVSDITNFPDLRGETALIVDATGVGRPVIDLMRHHRLSPIPVTIHAGTDESWDEAGAKVPKRMIVSALLLMFNGSRLKFARDLPFVKVLESELQNFKLKISQKGNDTYEAWRDKDHDDLVLALAIAAWYAQRTEPWERSVPRVRDTRDWDPLADEDEPPPPFNPMRFGGRR